MFPQVSIKFNLSKTHEILIQTRVDIISKETEERMWINTFLCGYQEDDARDLLFQFSIYLAVSALLIHLIFVVSALTICWRECTSMALFQVSVVGVVALGKFWNHSLL